MYGIWFVPAVGPWHPKTPCDLNGGGECIVEWSERAMKPTKPMTPVQGCGCEETDTAHVSVNERPMGFIVLTSHPDGSWQPDWDGRLHHNYEDAVAELGEARIGDSTEMAVLVQCRRLDV